MLAGPGDEEYAGALVRGTNVGRSNSCPLRIEPDFGKVSENTSERSENRSV